MGQNLKRILRHFLPHQNNALYFQKFLIFLLISFVVEFGDYDVILVAAAVALSIYFAFDAEIKVDLSGTTIFVFVIYFVDIVVAAAVDKFAVVFDIVVADIVAVFG